MKRFEIDTNFSWFGDSRTAIYSSVLREMTLQPGERVIVYQDDDEWYATVCYDASLPEQYRWYVTLDKLIQ